MVYKVLGDFTDQNLQEFISKLKYKYRILYYSNTLFLALKSYEEEVKVLSKDKDNSLNSISLQELTQYLTSQLRTEIFIPQESFWIKPLINLNDSNLSFSTSAYDTYLKTWIEENLIRLDKERLEIEKQKELKQVMESLNILEQEIEKGFIKLGSSASD